MLKQSLHSFSEAKLTRHVNSAFKQYHSLFSLAQSPLAHSSLITPVLVLDNVSPSADRRGWAFRLVLEWAAEQLAPETAVYPLGTYRPYEDPTWQDPRWWRYNIVRHRYLEPIHPDNFVEAGRFTETLLALTGIPSSDTFFDERNRAMREMAYTLRQQLLHGHHDETLRQLALQKAFRPLRAQPTAGAVLAIAATFNEAFARSLLLDMAAQERLNDVERALAYLVRNRFIMMEDESNTLWLSPILQNYVYQQQTRSKLRRRHQLIARYYASQRDSLKAAYHWQKAEHWPKAATLLLADAMQLVNELQIPELREALLTFKANQLEQTQWREVQITLSDLYYGNGQYEEALVACRRALKVTEKAAHQARVYRRMGKLYEKQNQRHALAYYQQAAERFSPGDSELVDMLKDRGWLYILREEWALAETDLQEALAYAPTAATLVRADILEALASLHRKQKRFDTAVAYAQQALALREEAGNLPRLADSFLNLGILYAAMGDYEHALAAYEEALQTYEKQNNQERIATALMNMGMAYHLDGRLSQAVDFYQRGLQLCQQTSLPHTEAKAHYNLAEALAASGKVALSRLHWQRGYDLSNEAQFDDLIAHFLKLREETSSLRNLTLKLPITEMETQPITRLELVYQPDPDEEVAMTLAEREGRVTAKRFMTVSEISKATATRKLVGLVERGILEKRGKGRGTHYVLRVVKEIGESGETAVMPDWTQLTQLLQQYKPVWQRQFSLNRLGIIGHTPDQAANILNFVADFTRLPDLRAFFELEEELAQIVNHPVDLKLFSQQKLAQKVMWI